MTGRKRGVEFGEGMLNRLRVQVAERAADEYADGSLRVEQIGRLQFVTHLTSGVDSD